MDQPLATESVKGPLTGHRIRFDGVEGTAGSYEPDEDKYTVFLDRGYTVDLRVKAKYIEDLGEAPLNIAVPWEERSVEVTCLGTSLGYSLVEHFVRVPKAKADIGTICWQCQLVRAKEGQPE